MVLDSYDVILVIPVLERTLRVTRLILSDFGSCCYVFEVNFVSNNKNKGEPTTASLSNLRAYDRLSDY